VDALSHLPELEGLMFIYPDFSEATEYVLETPPVQGVVENAKEGFGERRYPKVTVDRTQALFASWYEFFPRSAEGIGTRGSTFRDCLERVDDAKRMGFDVIYFPPIHPIGMSARKGKNNTVNVFARRTRSALCDRQPASGVPERRRSL